MSKYKKKGWRNESQRHSLAAKGIRTKYDTSKSFFLARQREATVPFSEIKSMVKSGFTFDRMLVENPEADKEDIRKRGIKAIESMEANDTLSTVDSNGTETIMNMARNNTRFKKELENIVSNEQKSSFIPQIKIDSIKMRMRRME